LLPPKSREGPSSDDDNAEPLPLGLRNPELLMMPPPTCGTVPVVLQVPRGFSARSNPLPFQLLLMSKADALFESGTLLGRGGEGEVRRVTIDSTDYALKWATGPAGEISFRNCLKSPWMQMPLGLCRGKGTKSNTSYVLFDLDTGSLADVLLGLWARSCAGMTLPEFRAVAAESLVALGRVHAAGLYHADIKPGNILVARDGHLRLCDFGCAGEVGEDPIGRGTRVFGAPEQRSGKLPSPWRLELRTRLQALAELLGFRYDFRSTDVWGLGVTWLCLLQPDFEEVQRVVAAAASWRRCPPREWRPPAWVPAEAAHLLFHCMLVRRPRARVSVRRLQRHAFFAGVDWSAVEARTVPLPLDLAALTESGRQVLQQYKEEQAQVMEGAQAAAAGPPR
jgi:serine/threonine protein kinase